MSINEPNLYIALPYIFHFDISKIDISTMDLTVDTLIENNIIHL
jgi:hypothetical protein